MNHAHIVINVLLRLELLLQAWSELAPPAYWAGSYAVPSAALFDQTLHARSSWIQVEFLKFDIEITDAERKTKM